MTILLMLALLTAGQGAPVPGITELRQRFEYDRSAPLAIEEGEGQAMDGIDVRALTYASPGGGRVTATLVRPTGAGPFAALIFSHWMVSPALGGDRTEFLREAMWLARGGVVSLLLDNTHRRPAPWRDPADPRDHSRDDQVMIHNVVDVRRAIDLLAARPDVDARRIGFVGHSYGANIGSIVAAVDGRLRALVLMAGVPSLTDLLRFNPNPEIVAIRRSTPPEALERYLRVMTAYDAVHYVPHIAPARVLFQVARTDYALPLDDARRYFEAARSPKDLRIYDGTGHDLSAEAFLDRAAWLHRQLKFEAPPGVAR